MPISPYFKSVRDKVGNDLLVVPSVSICHIDEQGRMLLMMSADTRRWNCPEAPWNPTNIQRRVLSVKCGRKQAST
jgi:hypothetical protein